MRGAIRKLVGGFVAIAIGTSLLPLVASQVNNSHFYISKSISLPKAKPFFEVQRQSYLDYVKERLAVERLMK